MAVSPYFYLIVNVVILSCAKMSLATCCICSAVMLSICRNRMSR